MIKAIVLCHPQSKNILRDIVFKSKVVEKIRIACGTTKPKNVDLYESGDFFPSYASWNAALFETSVILTVWEHADCLIGDDNVAFLHTDIKAHHKSNKIWGLIDKSLTEEPNRPIGLTLNIAYEGIVSDWEIPETMPFDVKRDPMRIHAFDSNIFVWDYIRKYDSDIYDYAMDTNPRMIYSHQFACTRENLNILGSRLFDIASKLRLRDIGFWTPHMFERLIALYLSQMGKPLLTSAFWHYSSSGTYGPGDLCLYGPRPFQYYKVNTKTKEYNSEAKQGKRPRQIRRNSDLDHL